MGYGAQTLEVEFTTGRVYRYSGVPERTYAAFMAADSHGEYFNRQIRDRFRFVEVLPGKLTTREIVDAIRSGRDRD